MVSSVGLAAPQMLDCQFVQHGFQSLVPFLASHLHGLEDSHDVLFDSHSPKDGGFLRQVSYPIPGTPIHGSAGQIVVVDPDSAVFRSNETHQ